MTVARAHEIAEHIEADIAERLPNTEVLVHIEPGSHEREDELLRTATYSRRPSGSDAATSTTVSAISVAEKAQATVL